MKLLKNYNNDKLSVDQLKYMIFCFSIMHRSESQKDEQFYQVYKDDAFWWDREENLYHKLVNY